MKNLDHDYQRNEILRYAQDDTKRVSHRFIISMRSKDAGAIEHVAQQFNQAETGEMWRKMCFSRFFEYRVKEAFDRGLFKMPIYLSIGQEAISSALSTVYKNPHIFAQHRCHDI